MPERAFLVEFTDSVEMVYLSPLNSVTEYK